MGSVSHHAPEKSVAQTKSVVMESAVKMLVQVLVQHANPAKSVMPKTLKIQSALRTHVGLQHVVMAEYVTKAIASTIHVDCSPAPTPKLNVVLQVNASTCKIARWISTAPTTRSASVKSADKLVVMLLQQPAPPNRFVCWVPAKLTSVQHPVATPVPKINSAALSRIFALIHVETFLALQESSVVMGSVKRTPVLPSNARLERSVLLEHARKNSVLQAMSANTDEFATS